MKEAAKIWLSGDNRKYPLLSIPLPIAQKCGMNQPCTVIVTCLPDSSIIIKKLDDVEL